MKRIFWFGFGLCMIALLFALAGCNEVLSTSNAGVSTTSAASQSPSSPPSPNRAVLQLDNYLIGGGLEIRSMNLRTDKSWTGSSSQDLKYTPPKTPWVINAGYTVTSKISSKFVVTVSNAKYNLIFGPQLSPINDKVWGITMEELGNFIIDVQSSGCDWWIKIGVE